VGRHCLPLMNIQGELIAKVEANTLAATIPIQTCLLGLLLEDLTSGTSSLILVLILHTLCQLPVGN
jgi:hypothetical protein